MAGAGGPAREPVSAVGVGDPAPDIEAVDADGGTWRLSAFREQGRPVVLIFHRHLA